MPCGWRRSGPSRRASAGTARRRGAGSARSRRRLAPWSTWRTPGRACGSGRRRAMPSRVPCWRSRAPCRGAGPRVRSWQLCRRPEAPPTPSSCRSSRRCPPRPWRGAAGRCPRSHSSSGASRTSSVGSRPQPWHHPLRASWAAWVRASWVACWARPTRCELRSGTRRRQTRPPRPRSRTSWRSRAPRRLPRAATSAPPSGHSRS
mmetsp:Transcript_96152/g.299516  ORF Transcript_96152/g.299516 Transcript_96152/m.299516 type:complete len:204 (+) Transcript_96152:709-1320(+)